MKVKARRIDNILLVLDLQVLAKVVDVHFEIIYDECSGCDVGHEVIDIPARHVVVSKGNQ